MAIFITSASRICNFRIVVSAREHDDSLLLHTALFKTLCLVALGLVNFFELGGDARERLKYPRIKVLRPGSIVPTHNYGTGRRVVHRLLVGALAAQCVVLIRKVHDARR